MKTLEQCLYESFGVTNKQEFALLEMSKVGEVDGYTIFVNSDDPVVIPHFHVCDTPSYTSKKKNGPYKFHTCIRIQESRYFIHGSKTDILNRKELKKMMNFLNKKHTRFNITYWEYIIMLWNDNNSPVNVPWDTKIPNYLEITM